jgi:hypothetical protein
MSETSSNYPKVLSIECLIKQKVCESYSQY